jgi:hypothetical protein
MTPLQKQRATRKVERVQEKYLAGKRSIKDGQIRTLSQKLVRAEVEIAALKDELTKAKFALYAYRNV